MDPARASPQKKRRPRFTPAARSSVIPQRARPGSILARAAVC